MFQPPYILNRCYAAFAYEKLMCFTFGTRSMSILPAGNMSYTMAALMFDHKTIRPTPSYSLFQETCSTLYPIDTRP